MSDRDDNDTDTNPEHGAIDLAAARREREQAALAAEIDGERAEAERSRAIGDALLRWRLAAEARGELPRPRDDDPYPRSVAFIPLAPRRPARGPAPGPGPGPGPATAPAPATEADVSDDDAPVRPIAIRSLSKNPKATAILGWGLAGAAALLAIGYFVFTRRREPEEPPQIVPVGISPGDNFFSAHLGLFEPMAHYQHETENPAELDKRLRRMRISFERDRRKLERERRGRDRERARAFSEYVDRTSVAGFDPRIFIEPDDGGEVEIDEHNEPDDEGDDDPVRALAGELAARLGATQARRTTRALAAAGVDLRSLNGERDRQKMARVRAARGKPKRSARGHYARKPPAT